MRVDTHLERKSLHAVLDNGPKSFSVYRQSSSMWGSALLETSHIQSGNEAQRSVSSSLMGFREIGD